MLVGETANSCAAGGGECKFHSFWCRSRSSRLHAKDGLRRLEGAANAEWEPASEPSYQRRKGEGERLAMSIERAATSSRSWRILSWHASSSARVTGGSVVGGLAEAADVTNAACAGGREWWQAARKRRCVHSSRRNCARLACWRRRNATQPPVELSAMAGMASELQKLSGRVSAGADS